MKKTILTALFLVFITFLQAQKIKIKKAKVLLDGKEIMNVQKENLFGAYGLYLSQLDSSKQIIKLILNSNGTHMYLDDDYIQIKFLTKGEQAEIKSRSLENTILMLIKNEVLNANGLLDESRIALFVKNFDEKITTRTIRQ